MSDPSICYGRFGRKSCWVVGEERSGCLDRVVFETTLPKPMPWPLLCVRLSVSPLLIALLSISPFLISLLFSADPWLLPSLQRCQLAFITNLPPWQTNPFAPIINITIYNSLSFSLSLSLSLSLSGSFSLSFIIQSQRLWIVDVLFISLFMSVFFGFVVYCSLGLLKYMFFLL